MHLIFSGWNFWLCVLLPLKPCLYYTQPGHYRSSFSCKNQCIQSNNSLYDLTDYFSHQSIWALSYQRLKTKYQEGVYQLWPLLFSVNSFSQMSLRGPASAAAVFTLVSGHTQHSALGASASGPHPFPRSSWAAWHGARAWPQLWPGHVHCLGEHRNGPSALKSFLCTGSARIQIHLRWLKVEWWQVLGTHELGRTRSFTYDLAQSIPSPGSSFPNAPTQGPHAPVLFGCFACPEHTMHIQTPVSSSMSPWSLLPGCPFSSHCICLPGGGLFII